MQACVGNGHTYRWVALVRQLHALLCRQFEVKDVAWDATLGSEALDLLLLDHFANEFKATHPGLDPRDSPKVPASRSATRCLLRCACPKMAL